MYSIYSNWNVFKLLFMLFIYFLDVKLFVNLMFFTIHPAPNIMTCPTIVSGVILNPNILPEYIALIQMVNTSEVVR